MYSIRPATQADLPLLPQIEQAAGLMYLQTQYKDLASAPNVSQHIAAEDRVWVAVCVEEIVAFAIVKIVGDIAHLHELDVHPAHARRRIGRDLITHIADWARCQRMRAVTLTTFSDVPWNGPYYARLGFTQLGRSTSLPHLQRVLDEEARGGMPMQHRVAMKLPL